MKYKKLLKFSLLSIIMLLIILVDYSLLFGSEKKNGPVASIHLERLEEIYGICDSLGDELWPGFRIGNHPLLLNIDNKREVLIGHPAPPKDFKILPGYRFRGEPFFTRENCLMLMTHKSGTSRKFAGIKTTIVSTRGGKTNTEKYLSVVIHESFHSFQASFFGAIKSSPEDFPIYDVTQAGLLALENRLLYKALLTKDHARARELVRKFLAIRSYRRSLLPAPIRSKEDIGNRSEGTAMYAQIRLFQLLSKREPLKSILVKSDHHYNGFINAARDYKQYIDKLNPLTNPLVTLGGHIYENGMAQCFLLDRFRPGWKKEMKGTALTPFQLLKREFPQDEKINRELVKKISAEFDLNQLQEVQKKHIEEIYATVKPHIAGKGVKYRFYYNEITPYRFRWLAGQPLYMLTTEMLDNPEPWETGLLFLNGLKHFEKGDILFKSRKVPILFRQKYIQWTNFDPKPGLPGIKIDALHQEGDIYGQVTIKTGGFTLQLGKARVIRKPGLIEIHPMTSELQEKKD